jgi:hypothetical protein
MQNGLNKQKDYMILVTFTAGNSFSMYYEHTYYSATVGNSQSILPPLQDPELSPNLIFN